MVSVMAESSTAVSTSPPFMKDQLHVTLCATTSLFQKEANSGRKSPPASPRIPLSRSSSFCKPLSSSSIAAAATQGNISQTRPKSNTITGICTRPTQSLDYRQAKQLGACEPYTRRRPRSHAQPDRTPAFLIMPKTLAHGELIHPFLPLSSFQLHSMLSQCTKEPREEVLRFPSVSVFNRR